MNQLYFINPEALFKGSFSFPHKQHRQNSVALLSISSVIIEGSPKIFSPSTYPAVFLARF